jgi:hypothetical protein
MQSIWVLEDIKKSNKFSLPDLELLSLIASVSNWSILYPESRRSLYCSISVFEYLRNLEILHLWEDINTSELEDPDSIDRRPFWAASKIKIIKNLKSPFIMMDCDLFFTKRFFDLEDFLAYDVAANCVELGNMLYPSYKDKFLRDMITQDQTQFSWDNTHAFDVSFLYIGNDDLREKYSDLAFKWMEELSIQNPNDPMLNGNYMIFCEQKILKEFTDLMNLKSVFLCPDLTRIDGKNAPLPDQYKTMGGSDSDYFHLGPLKRKAEDDPNLTLDIRSRIIKSMVDLNNPHIKLAFFAIEKN